MYIKILKEIDFKKLENIGKASTTNERIQFAFSATWTSSKSGIRKKSRSGKWTDRIKKKRSRRLSKRPPTPTRRKTKSSA